MEIHLREIIPWEKQAASECPVMGMKPMHPLNGTGAEQGRHDGADSSPVEAALNNILGENTGCPVKHSYSQDWKTSTHETHGVDRAVS